LTQLKHQIPGIPASPYQPLNEPSVRRIADAALDVLEQSGMAVSPNTAFEALQSAGADADAESRSDLTVSYEKLAMDNEILGMCQRVLRGIEVDDDTLGTDLLIEKGPGTDFMTEEHTIRHMRQEFFVPKLANRRKRESTSSDDNAMARAKMVVEQARSSQYESLLGSELRDEPLQAFPQIRTSEEVCLEHGVKREEYCV